MSPTPIARMQAQGNIFGISDAVDPLSPKTHLDWIGVLTQWLRGGSV